MKRNQWINQLLTMAVLCMLAVIVLYPILLILTTSMKSNKEFMDYPIGLPIRWTFSNYISAFHSSKFTSYALNSIVVSGVSVSCAVLLSSMSAYGIVVGFRGSKLTLNFFLIGLMVPMQATSIALFIFIKQLGIMSTLTSLILVNLAFELPIGIFIFSRFFKTIPKALEESALLDGCGLFRIYWKIIMPISTPVISTVIIMSVLNVWNDFFLPFIIIQDQTKYTLPVGLMQLRGEYNTNWPQFFAAMGMQIVPILVLYMFLQRYFIKGLISGSVKG